MSRDPATSGKSVGLGHSLHCKLVVTASLFCKAATFFLAKLSRTCCQGLVVKSDISSIDHLALREFVSGPPRYHLAIKGVREQFVIVEQNSGP